jgi:hypothetical protein
MFIKIHHLVGICLASLASLPVTAATLPSVSFTSFDATARAGLVGTFYSSIVEDFEMFSVGEQSGSLATSVGRFETLGGTGSGATVRGTSGNTGTGAYLRDNVTYGRVNTTVGGDQFLDSNDTYGITWQVAGLGMFDRLFFTISDLADSGANFSLLANGDTILSVAKGRGNGTVDMVMLSFGTAISELTLTLRQSKLNDGFGIDDAGVGLDRPPSAIPPTSVVPLPPAMALLLAGLGAVAALRHTSQRRAQRVS